jgi:hypothetical protein
MKKLNLRYILTTLGLFAAQIAFAASDFGSGAPKPSGLSYAIQNPLAFDTLQEFIVAILNVIVIIATPIVVVFIILSGFKYVTAQGNPAKIQEATKSLTYAIIGGVLILGAKAISLIIANLVTAFGS